jgi:hypothetical protein
MQGLEPTTAYEMSEPTKIVDANGLRWEFLAEHPLPKR